MLGILLNFEGGSETKKNLFKMKAIIRFIMFCVFFISFSTILKAQEVDNPQETLMEETWYLIKTEIDNEEHPFIANEEIEQVILDFNLDPEHNNVHIFSPTLCEALEWSLSFVAENEFSTAFEMDLAYNWCTDGDNIYYDNFYYLGGFWSNQKEHPFEFYITQEEEYKALVITGNENDKAYFQSVPYMSVNNREKSNLTIYPNPANDFLYIENLTEPIQVEIYDLSGKVLLSQEANEARKQVNLSQLSNGIYLYELSQNGQGIKTGKMIKN